MRAGAGSRAAETRSRNSRERDNQLKAGLLAARTQLRKWRSLVADANVGTVSDCREIDAALAKVDQALWRLGIHT